MHYLITIDIIQPACHSFSYLLFSIRFPFVLSHLILGYQQFKEVCPPHKQKDLDALVRKYRGDENKIQSQIQEWWEQPQTREEEWEDVSKKTTSRAHIRSSGGGGSGSSGVGGGFRSERGNSGRGGGGHGRSGGGGRGGFNRAMSGGRGGGSDRRSNRDYGKKGGSRNIDKLCKSWLFRYGGGDAELSWHRSGPYEHGLVSAVDRRIAGWFRYESSFRSYLSNLYLRVAWVEVGRIYQSSWESHHLNLKWNRCIKHHNLHHPPQ